MRASSAVNMALAPDQKTFFPFSAEWMFLQILMGYYNELTTDAQIAARVERRIAPMALQGVPAAELAVRRRAMRAQLEDRRGLFDVTYRRFFFVDKSRDRGSLRRDASGRDW